MSDFLFRAKDGGMDFGSAENHHRIRKHLKEHEGALYRISPERHTRTLSQNALYWLYLEVIERETGNSANELHEYFRRAFLKPKFISVLGNEIKIPRSTTELTSAEFSDYLAVIERESGIPLPDTEKYLFEQDLAPLK